MVGIGHGVHRANDAHGVAQYDSLGGGAMNPEKKGQVALKFWWWKFCQPEFVQERAKIETNASRIAGQIGVVNSDFTMFLRFVGLSTHTRPINGYEYDRFGPIALKLFEHRLQPVNISNSLRRWTIGVARSIGESDSDCLELVREILTEKICVYLN